MINSTAMVIRALPANSFADIVDFNSNNPGIIKNPNPTRASTAAVNRTIFPICVELINVNEQRYYNSNDGNCRSNGPSVDGDVDPVFGLYQCDDEYNQCPE